MNILSLFEGGRGLMKERFLPVIIGAYDEADKVSIFGRHRILRSGRSLYICRLKKPAKRGDPMKDFDENKDIKSVCCHIHFCKKEALRVFIRQLNMMLDSWEEEGK